MQLLSNIQTVYISVVCSSYSALGAKRIVGKNFMGNAKGGAPFIMLVFICAIALLLLLPAVNEI